MPALIPILLQLIEEGITLAPGLLAALKGIFSHAATTAEVDSITAQLLVAHPQLASNPAPAVGEFLERHPAIMEK